MRRTTEQWEALLDGATPGPWDYDDIYPDCSNIVDDNGGRNVELAFVAPEAVAEVVRLRREIEWKLEAWELTAQRIQARGDHDGARFMMIMHDQLAQILNGDTDE